MNYSRLRFHFFLALFLGFLARALAAYWVYGAQSVDDYSHGVLPALELLVGKDMDIPLWRSPLLVWFLTAIVGIGQQIGVDSVFGQIRFLFLGLGTFSLLTLWAYFEFVKKKGEPDFKGDLRDRLILFPFYFFALHPIFPIGTTRAFGESIAMTLVIVSLLMLEMFVDQPKKSRGFFLGGILLGVACLFRFQVGLLAVGYAAYLLSTRRWQAFGWLAAAGVLALMLEGGIDLAFGRWPLETLYNYFDVNKDGAIQYTNQPWYNTWASVLFLCFVPLSIPLLKGLGNLTRTEKVFLGLSLFFTFMHSLIPHKEERFLFPIAPLLLYVFARLWARAWGSGYEKYFFRPVVGSLLAFLLFASVTSNSQSGEYEPLLRAEQFQGRIAIWDWKSVLQESYFRDRLLSLIGERVEYRTGDRWPNPDEIETLHNRFQGLMLATSQPEIHLELKELQKHPPTGLQCEPIRKIQSLGDQVLYSLNPNFNTRRKPVWLTICRW